ncbi:hypothetical protein FRC04_006680 [Tulasnella sp. 424]|nr:hypothetical protein FRC04_006680 [Tulasnella sp. 424]
MKIQPRPDSFRPTSNLVLSTPTLVLPSHEQEATATPPSPTGSVSSLLAIDIPPSQPPRRVRASDSVDFDEFRRKNRLFVVNPDPPSDDSSEAEPHKNPKRRRREVSVISSPGTPLSLQRPKRIAASTLRRPECGICKEPITVKPNNPEGPSPEDLLPSETPTGLALRCYGANLGHTYCFPCMATYFRTKLDDAPFKTVFPIRCPECPYIIIEDLAKRILTKQDMEGMWYWAKLFADVQTTAALGLNNPLRNAPVRPGEQIVPLVRRRFVTAVKSSGTKRASGVVTLDRALEKLAKKEKWRRCPKCRIVVERRDAVAENGETGAVHSEA